MLATPIGVIEITIDGEAIPYRPQRVPCDRFCRDLDGRYSVTVKLVPDGKAHTIACRIKSHLPFEWDDIEPGESLELKSFYQEGVKLSIGMEGDAGYVNGKRCSDEYDYDNEYLDDGVQYVIFSSTKTEDYVFGIAWICDVQEDNTQTWFGADPVSFRLN